MSRKDDFCVECGRNLFPATESRMTDQRSDSPLPDAQPEPTKR